MWKFCYYMLSISAVFLIKYRNTKEYLYIKVYIYIKEYVMLYFGHWKFFINFRKCSIWIYHIWSVFLAWNNSKNSYYKYIQWYDCKYILENTFCTFINDIVYNYFIHLLSDILPDRDLNELIGDAFLRFFLASVGHYKDCMVKINEIELEYQVRTTAVNNCDV